MGRIAIALIAALVGYAACLAQSPAAQAGGCGDYGAMTGCSGDGSVSVRGGHESGGRSNEAPGSGPIIPIKLLACGQVIAGAPELRIPIPTVGNEFAAMCNAWKERCKANKRNAQQPSGAAVVVRIRPNGREVYQSMTCLGTQPPEVTPEMVRQRVVRLIPSATIGLAPRDSTLVNIETVMWVDAPATRTLPAITILGQQVVVRLKLDHVDWNFGDGSSATSDGPGKAYDEQNDPCHGVRCPDYFGHVYRDTGRTNIAATAYWQASFTVDGGHAVNIPGTVAGPAGRAEITVKQARAVLVPNP